MAEPANLKFLRRLVTTLTMVMIAGVVLIVALLVIRLQQPPASSSELVLPDTIALPDGTAATAFTQGPNWYAIVTAEGEILIYNRATSRLIQRVQITVP